VFKYRLWLSSLITLSGIVLLFTLPMRSGWAALIPALLCYMALALITTVILHRHYSHKAFKVGPLLRSVFPLLSVLPLQGSPLVWSAVHMAHHKHADTELDPHRVRLDWSAIFDFYSDKNRVMRPMRGMAKDQLHRIVFSHFWLIWAAAALLMYAASPVLLLDVYLPAVALLKIVTVVVLYWSHHKGTPRDFPFMEFFIPAGGEWSHIKHHKFPGHAKHGKFDLGYFVIKMIAKPGSVR
jgi:fatty-acid desaturase